MLSTILFSCARRAWKLFKKVLKADAFVKGKEVDEFVKGEDITPSRKGAKKSFVDSTFPHINPFFRSPPHMFIRII